MKKILFLMAVAILLPIVSTAQKKEMTKEQKKAAQELALKDLYDRAVKAMNDRKFIMQGDELSYQNDKTNPVSPGANFISIEGEQAVIQLFPGGNFNTRRDNITLRGTASNIEMRTNKKGKVTFKMYVVSNDISVTVTITMDSKSNECRAVITPNFSGDRITLYGNLFRIDETNIPFYDK